MKRFALYCTCGAGWTGTVSKNGHGIILRYWNEIHSGEGHRLCGARLASGRRAATRTQEDTIIRNMADRGGARLFKPDLEPPEEHNFGL